ncbi:MAG: hypothetical protein QM756_09980 [Polyangiaceae bacterium]
MSEQKPSSVNLSYKDAGVDIEAGDNLVERIKGVAKRTTRKEVLGGLGGFGALVKIPAGYRNRCWSPAPTVWVPSSSWPCNEPATNASASTWWRCA